MIFTLAGHVDHGKSSLVSALTGARTDRLAEEKRRGLTIDLGFAYADFDGVPVGFVDVPGHHRFVHNMVAGVASGQTALVVVAADDGVMPQTREHVTILALIGVTRAVIAISKCDRSEEARWREVERDARALLADARIEVLDAVPTAIALPETIARLRTSLARAASHPAGAQSAAPFRLAVDRAFNVRGIGLVVTGTVHAGRIGEGDFVRIAPRGHEARVRSLRVRDRPADRAQAGDRTALHLTGVDIADVGRGDWIVAPSAFAPTPNVVVSLTVAPDFPRAVRQGLPVHVYHATSHAEGRVSLLEGNRLAPGETMLAELLLDAPLNPKRHDRVVLRDHGLDCTVGGGEVIDIVTVARGKRSRARLARLTAQTHAEPGDALRALLAIGDVEREEFRANWCLEDDALDRLSSVLDAVRRTAARRDYLLDAGRWRSYRDAIVSRVEAAHAADPDAPGARRADVAAATGVPVRWFDPVVQELVSERLLDEAAGVLRRPGHRARLSDADAALLERIERRLAADGQPPSVGDLAKELRLELARLKGFVQRMHAARRLVRVSESRVLLPAQVERLIAIVREVAERQPAGFSARDVRDAAGMGRNLVIEVLEYFDDRGFTKRFAEARRIVGNAPL
jgi:selenocysteine-specific elongation factor